MSAPKQGHSASHGSSSGMSAQLVAPNTQLPALTRRSGEMESILSAPQLPNNGRATTASHSQAVPFAYPLTTQNSYRHDQPQPSQQIKRRHNQYTDRFQNPHYLPGMSSFGFQPRVSSNSVYPPYTNYGYEPYPPVQYVPPPAVHASYPMDPYSDQYYSLYTAPRPVPSDAPPPQLYPHMYPPIIQQSTYVPHQSTNFQQIHLRQSAPQRMTPYGQPQSSSRPLPIYQRDSYEPLITPGSTTVLNQVPPKKVQVAVAHITSAEPPDSPKQTSHIAKNLAALAVIQREIKVKSRVKRRATVNTDLADREFERMEEASADDFDNRQKGKIDSPTLKHRCGLGACTRNFATLRLLQKHQSLKHAESLESNVSTPVSQDGSLTPKGSRKKQKLSPNTDWETRNLDSLQSGSQTNPGPALEPTPSLEKIQAISDLQPLSSASQISAESEQTLQREAAKTPVEKPALAVVEVNEIFDDEDLNDDE
ncbi:hypothetical protein BJ741DRAFT_587887 [Chytriomyces cf. hyalinus JEL632]|nr:hypothetical protein BJ741DRAFT_587887 [Chytriomyces cf. hyalinus JEL632]